MEEEPLLKRLRYHNDLGPVVRTRSRGLVGLAGTASYLVSLESGAAAVVCNESIHIN